MALMAAKLKRKNWLKFRVILGFSLMAFLDDDRPP
jgi:hypothetical protein